MCLETSNTTVFQLQSPDAGAGVTLDSQIHVRERRLGSEDATNPAATVAASVLTTGRAIAVIIQLAGMNFLASFNNGLITLTAPIIGNDLHLSDNLIAWPLSVFSLACGATLLLAGSIADAIGARNCNLGGALFVALLTTVLGISRTGIHLIVFRIMQGIAAAFAIPSSISIISTTLRSGRPRNIGFATLGLAQPFGFSCGLVLGGIFVDTIGWRAAFYMGGGFGFLLFLVGFWALPKGIGAGSLDSVWKQLAVSTDWIGGCLSSASLGTFSYLLA